MGNELLSRNASGKLKDPMAFFMKYFPWINFVKLLSILSPPDPIGNNKLFKTVLGTIDNEGPVVVKTYLAKIKDKSELSDRLESYKATLEKMKKTFQLNTHPNLMPYQGLDKNEVSFLFASRLAFSFVNPTIFSIQPSSADQLDSTAYTNGQVLAFFPASFCALPNAQRRNLSR